jgi:hypothetical protein
VPPATTSLTRVRSRLQLSAGEPVERDVAPNGPRVAGADGVPVVTSVQETEDAVVYISSCSQGGRLHRLRTQILTAARVVGEDAT